MKPIQIFPSLLACNFSKFGEEILQLEKAGADAFHFDVMDGHFVPNITLGFPIIENLRQCTKLPFDAHLMISNADRFIDDFHRAGCNWISVHIEACPHVHRTLFRIRELGMKAGIAINPGTSLTSLEEALSHVDYVLVMSVNPGFGGQKFIPETFERIKSVEKMIGTRPISIQVDGGIKESNIEKVAHAGANIFVVGTGLFESKNYVSKIAQLRKAT